MNIDGPLISATFIERPNRFITLIRLNEEVHSSHLPDPGRLKELLIPGAKLLVRPVKSAKRKTSYTTVMVNHNGRLISLVSTLPNTFVKHALENDNIPIFKTYKLVRPEVKVDRHRFDFLLCDHNNNNFYLEVKSVTFVKNKIAKFPDAVTKRGMSHAMALGKIVEEGGHAGILFVCQRPDANSFQPMWKRDPQFSKALLHAHQVGVKVWCITLNISKTKITYKKEIPINFKKDKSYY